MDTLRSFLFVNAMIFSSLLLLNIRHVLGQVKICLESCPTIRRAETCPVTEEEWRKKEKIFACDKIVQNCSEPDLFRYHCMMDEKGKIIELCATMACIIGKVCPVFDRGGALVQELYSRECLNCSFKYPSSDLFKYPQCFSNTSTSTMTYRDTKTTASTQTTHPNEYVKNDSNRIQKYIDPVDESDKSDVWKIVLILFVVLTIIITSAALVAWRFCKLNEASERLERDEGSKISGEKEKFVKSPTSDDNRLVIHVQNNFAIEGTQ